MPQMPQPVVSGHKVLDAAAAIAADFNWAPGEHGLKDAQQAPGYLEVGRVTSMMEGDQNLVWKAPGVQWKPSGCGATQGGVIQWCGLATLVLFRNSAHIPPCFPICWR